jgi:hypothetical protein
MKKTYRTNTAHQGGRTHAHTHTHTHMHARTLSRFLSSLTLKSAAAGSSTLRADLQPLDERASTASKSGIWPKITVRASVVTWRKSHNQSQTVPTTAARATDRGRPSPSTLFAQ